MGSQNVTDFSKAKKSRIRDALKHYTSGAAGAELAWEAAATALGPLTKSNPFVQGLSSSSVDNALDLLISLTEEFKRSKGREELAQVLQKHNIDPKVQKPLLRLTSEMTKSLSDLLSSRQGESDSAFAAKDAIPKTIIDVLSEVLPREKADTASPEEISRAFAKVGESGLAEIFFRNVFSSLMKLALDASRGRVPPEVIEKIIEETKDETGLAAGLSRSVLQLAPGAPGKITKEISKLRKRTKKKGKVILVPFPPQPPQP